MSHNVVEAGIDLSILFVFKPDDYRRLLDRSLGRQLCAFEDAAPHVLQTVLHDFPSTLGVRVHVRGFVGLAVAQSPWEAWLDLLREAEVLQDRLGAVGASQDGELQLCVLGSVPFETKRRW